MVQTDTLIIGQGLCGTWLSYWLQKAGRDFMLIDEDRPMSSSRIASGVINPVTGRALAETWMAQFLLDFCTDVYTDIGNELNISCIKTVDVLHSSIKGCQILASTCNPLLILINGQQSSTCHLDWVVSDRLC